MEVRVVPYGARVGPGSQSIAVTMRTPGHDFELAAGFLFSEGLLHSVDEITRMSYCTEPEVDRAQQYNIVNVWLRAGVNIDLEASTRRFFAASSCGVCGKGTLDAIRVAGCRSVADGGPYLLPETIVSLPEKLRASQSLFERTGGIHAAALFDGQGRLLSLREDVGRHNAVDKLLGEAFLHSRVPLSEYVLVVSGRTSFEIMQKAALAGIPFVVSVSAPSSLAVELADEFNMSLVGFVRGSRFNVYAGQERIVWDVTIDA